MARREVYYFGRGSDNCIAATYRPGDFVEIFVGNGKTREAGSKVRLDKCQMPELVEFFKAVRDGTMHKFIEERAYPGVPVENYIEFEDD